VYGLSTAICGLNIRSLQTSLRITNGDCDIRTYATGIMHAVYVPPLCEHNGLGVTTAAMGWHCFCHRTISVTDKGDTLNFRCCNFVIGVIFQ